MSSDMTLHVLDHIPDGLLSRPANRLHEVLAGPTLIHLPGREQDTLFLSVLLHGNEDTGWEAVRALLAEGQGLLPRGLSLFIGNVAAARHRMRALDGQADFNRVWPGTAEADRPEARLMAQVVDEVTRRDLFVSVDLHNNTGINPHYGCVNVLDHRFLHLAALFSRTVVYFIRPKGVQSMALAPHCPAVTIECGKVGSPGATEHARQYVEACLKLSALPRHAVAASDIDLFHTVATVTVPDHIEMAFESDDSPATLRLVDDMDHLNFRELPAETVLGFQSDPYQSPCVRVTDEDGLDVTREFFAVRSGQLRLRKPALPSMLTTNPDIIRQDCLCYLMERYPLPPPPSHHE